MQIKISQEELFFITDIYGNAFVSLRLHGSFSGQVRIQVRHRSLPAKEEPAEAGASFYSLDFHPRKMGANVLRHRWGSCAEPGPAFHQRGPKFSRSAGGTGNYRELKHDSNATNTSFPASQAIAAADVRSVRSLTIRGKAFLCYKTASASTSRRSIPCVHFHTQLFM